LDSVASSSQRVLCWPAHNTLRFVNANINCSCLGIGWYALDEIYLNCLYVTAFFEALNSAELYIVNARELMSSAINLSRFDRECVGSSVIR